VIAYNSIYLSDIIMCFVQLDCCLSIRNGVVRLAFNVYLLVLPATSASEVIRHAGAIIIITQP